jgi:hypothetical protein
MNALRLFLLADAFINNNRRDEKRENRDQVGTDSPRMMTTSPHPARKIYNIDRYTRRNQH